MKKEELRTALAGKERMFALYYAISNNALDAARKAGYDNPHLARRKLINAPLVVLLVLLLRKLMIEDYLVQTEYCVKLWKSLIQMAKAANDYIAAANIVLKISKLKEPVNAASITGLIKINIV